MPAQDDWLNEWSSTPPVSSTMHAFELLSRVALAAGLRVGRLATADCEQGKSAPHYGDDLGCVTQGIALLLSWRAVEHGHMSAHPKPRIGTPA